MSHGIGRRAFLKQAAVAAGAGVALPYVVRSSALGKAGSVAASERITLGMIGTGSHGRDMNLKTFLTLNDAQVVAVCDVDRTTDSEEIRQAVRQRAALQRLSWCC
jgi:hypothetical protein